MGQEPLEHQPNARGTGKANTVTMNHLEQTGKCFIPPVVVAAAASDPVASKELANLCPEQLQACLTRPRLLVVGTFIGRPGARRYQGIRTGTDTMCTRYRPSARVELTLASDAIISMSQAWAPFSPERRSLRLQPALHTLETAIACMRETTISCGSAYACGLSSSAARLSDDLYLQESPTIGSRRCPGCFSERCCYRLPASHARQCLKLVPREPWPTNIGLVSNRWTRKRRRPCRSCDQPAVLLPCAGDTGGVIPDERQVHAVSHLRSNTSRLTAAGSLGAGYFAV